MGAFVTIQKRGTVFKCSLLVSKREQKEAVGYRLKLARAHTAFRVRCFPEMIYEAAVMLSRAVEPANCFLYIKIFTESKPGPPAMPASACHHEGSERHRRCFRSVWNLPGLFSKQGTVLRGNSASHRCC